MSEPKKKKCLAFPLGLILGILSIAALAIATVLNAIPAESARGNGPFGTVVAIKDFLTGFTFAQDALKGAVLAAIVAIALFVILLVMTLVAIKRNPKKVASGVAVTILSVYDSYLLRSQRHLGAQRLQSRGCHHPGHRPRRVRRVLDAWHRLACRPHPREERSRHGRSG